MGEIEQVFIKILNMSLNASFVVIAVLLIRFIFRKIPKKYAYLLWVIVFLRFLWPFTVESVVSLIPVRGEPITYESLASVMSYEEGGLIFGLNTYKDNSTSNNNGMSNISGGGNSLVEENVLLENKYLLEGDNNVNANINHSFDYIEIASLIWVAIALLLPFVSIVKLVNLKIKLRTATLTNKAHERIYETDQIISPFIIGIVSPRIYLPIGLSDREMCHVIKHEQMHWKRKDNLVKIIAFFAVILHWFNPFVWLSYYLLIKDMEMSCDEMIMEQTEEDIRQDYSKTLLSLSIKQSGLLSPLAFGESNTESRVKNVLNFKKPSSWVSIVAIILVVITAVTLLTNSKQAKESLPQVGVDEPQTIENMGQYTIHRTQRGGESRLSYTRSELEELFGNLYSYSESPEKLIKFMITVDDYLDGAPVSVETKQYSGRALTIGIIGEVPNVREEQIEFVDIQFSDLEDETFQEKYDAIFITKDNLSEAAEDKYASIYMESTIPIFFIQSDKSYVPFVNEGLSYEEVPNLGGGYYVSGILYTINQGWGFGLYNDIENATNIKDVYSRVFKQIDEAPDPKAVQHVMSLDFRKLLAKKLNVDYENNNIGVVSGNIVTDNGITMTVGSTYNNGVAGSILLAFSKDNGEIFYNSMNPNLENLLLKEESDKELECLFTTELSEDSKILFCYLSYVNTAAKMYDLVSFNIQNLANNQSQVDGATFKDEIIYGNWSSTLGIKNSDEAIRVANTTLNKTVSMCGKELQIDGAALANNVVVINTTVLKDEGLPMDKDALLSSVSTESGAYYGVYVNLVYEDGKISDKINCHLDDEGNIIAWLYEPIDIQSVKTVIVGDVSIEMKK